MSWIRAAYFQYKTNKRRIAKLFAKVVEIAKSQVVVKNE